MVNTRSGSSPSAPIVPASASKKRGSEDTTENSPPKKRGRPAKKQTTPAKGSTEKKQMIIEESMDVDTQAEGGDEVKENGGENGGNGEKNGGHKTESKEEANGNAEVTKEGDNHKAIDETVKGVDPIEDDSEVAEQMKDDAGKRDKSKKTEDKNGEANGVEEGEKNAIDEVKGDTEVKKDAEDEQKSKTESITDNDQSVIKDPEREVAIPSSILEKGIIYFFYRPRVGTTEAQGIEDTARSFIVLRPLPRGAKLSEGPLEDSGNARLLALPKKVLPKSTRDQFLMFTENVKSTVKEIRKQFASNECATKTSGSGSHLAYLLTKPESLGPIQEDFGLHRKGSFVLSAKNLETPGPAYATIANPAKYPEELQKRFRGRRWMPLEPELLDYEGTQFLIIGEGFGKFRGAIEEMSKDKKDDEKEKPEEELEKLEEEDHDRVANLKEDDAVFADLGLSSKEYSKMQTEW